MGKFYQQLHDDEKTLVDKVALFLTTAERAIHKQKKLSFDAAEFTAITQEKLARQITILTYPKFDSKLGKYANRAPKSAIADAKLGGWWEENKASAMQLWTAFPAVETDVQQTGAQMQAMCAEVLRKEEKKKQKKKEPAAEDATTHVKKIKTRTKTPAHTR